MSIELSVKSLLNNFLILTYLELYLLTLSQSDYIIRALIKYSIMIERNITQTYKHYFIKTS
jgi:hypothetical protein